MSFFYIFSIGLCGFDNPMRDQKTEEYKRHIGQVSNTLNDQRNYTCYVCFASKLKILNSVSETFLLLFIKEFCYTKKILRKYL